LIEVGKERFLVEEVGVRFFENKGAQYSDGAVIEE
jgi:hypothetical protein